MKFKYFNIYEFDQKDMPGSGRNMSMVFVEMLDILREGTGFPMVVSSGWRSPEHNADISTTGLNGPHTTGRAADIRCTDPATAHTIIKMAMQSGFTGIGLASSFIHLDNLTRKEGFSRPAFWTYPNRKGETPQAPIYTSGWLMLEVLKDALKDGRNIIINQHGQHSGRYIKTSEANGCPRIEVGA